MNRHRPTQQSVLFDVPRPELPVWPPPDGDDPQRVLVTASRYLTDASLVGWVLGSLLRVYGALIVVHGQCPTGGDWLTDQWVARQEFHGAPVTAEPHPADWDTCGPECPIGDQRHRLRRHAGDVWHPGALPTYCPTAGPRRNRVMVARGARVCVGFRQPGRINSGTRGCMALAEHAGIPTFGFDAEEPDW